MKRNRDGAEQPHRSVRTDGEGASAGEAPPVIEDLVIERFAERRAGSATGGTGYEPSENCAGYATAHCTDRAAERADNRAGLDAGQYRSGATRRTGSRADGTPDAPGDVALLGAERLARGTRIHKITLARTVAGRFTFVWLCRLMYFAKPIQCRLPR
ncbi:hypothetical protein [Burkholderia ambifaria]|uniref:hypothetical protein n=1 Tax=Burkholderia ambifaria TaxID=152480 RepID=UPI001B9AB11A|nr:hypothetical protein [Burkholderia ambifaria]MBR8225042.1 hypothetical protein [Burkholderia ambifaria]